MKLPHAAAFALVGWYLMVPAVTPEGLIDPNATLVNGKALPFAIARDKLEGKTRRLSRL
jgi:hypothetical protein